MWVVVLCAAVLSVFVVLPLIGQPPVTRVAPILLGVGLILVLSRRPWKWSAAEWARFEDWRPSNRVVLIAAVGVGIVLFWFVLTRFQSGQINAIDFTVYYDRPLFQTTLGRPLFVESADDSVRSHRTYFSVHAHWIMLPLAALYLVWASPLWLLALSVLAVVVGAVYTLRIIQQQGGGGVLACAGALAFVLNDNTARTLNYGFHVEVLYAWFIPWMIYSALTRRWKSFLIAALACVAVKEDAVLLMFAVAAALFLIRGRSLTGVERLVIVAPVAAAAAHLVFYYEFLIPRLSPSGAPFYANYWANYGPTAMTAFLGMVRHPDQVLASTVTSGFTTQVIVPHLYLPLIGWRWMLGIAPVIFLYGASANEQVRSFGVYYAIVLVPFLVLSATAGAQRVVRWAVTNHRHAQTTAATLLLLGALIARISDAGYSLRPWKSEIADVPNLIGQFHNQDILAQSGLYPHAGYESRVQLLTKETLNDPRYASAILLLAPGVNAFPLTSGEIAPLLDLPFVLRTSTGLVAVQRAK